MTTTMRFKKCSVSDCVILSDWFHQLWEAKHICCINTRYVGHLRIQNNRINCEQSGCHCVLSFDTIEIEMGVRARFGMCVCGTVYTLHTITSYFMILLRWAHTAGRDIVSSHQFVAKHWTIRRSPQAVNFRNVWWIEQLRSRFSCFKRMFCYLHTKSTVMSTLLVI